MDGRPDQAVLERATGGDQAAWNEIVDAYDRLVWHVILGFGLRREDTADVHQTTWLRLAENLHKIRDAERMGSWLATTARRECLRVSASRSREIPTETRDDIATDDRHLDAGLIDDERSSVLWRAFAMLGQRCQQLLRLLIAEPAFSYEEIGVILEMPTGSVGPTRSRCLAKLAQAPPLRALREWS